MSPEKLEAIETWLRDNLPGGRWILPHWQDGPFHLVSVSSTEGANWQAMLLLDAHTPLAAGLPFYDGYALRKVDVFAVSTFVYETLCWHQDEYGLQLELDYPIAAFEEMPTATDVLTNLDLLCVDSTQFGEHTEQIQASLDKLRAAGSDGLRALCAIDPDAVSAPEGSSGDGIAERILTVLAAATAIVSPTPA